MVESMVALVLVDHLMMQKAQCDLFPNAAAVADQPNPMGKTARREGGPLHVQEHAHAGPVSQRVDEE